MKRLYKISLIISGIATAIGSGAMGVLLGEIVRDYGLASSQEGLMSSCISAGALIALVCGILLRGKIPKVGFIIGGGVLMSLMLFLKSRPAAFGTFLCICLVMGIGMGIMDCFQSAFLSDLDPEHVAKNLGLFHAIFGIGGVTLPLILRGLLTRYEWRTVYVIISVVTFLLIAQFAAATVCVRKEPVLRQKEKSQSFQQMFLFLKSPVFVLLLICMFAGAAAQNGILVWTVRYVSHTLGDAVLAPVCLSVYWACSTLSRLFAPWLPFRPIRILAVGSVISGLAWFAGIVSGTPMGMLAACVIAGLSSGCCIPLLLNEGAVFSRDNTGLTTSMLMFVKTVGQMVTPVFIAAMQGQIGATRAIFLIGVFFVLDGIIALWIARASRRTQPAL